jgi:Bacterial Ig-like domain (group 3)
MLKRKSRSQRASLTPAISTENWLRGLDLNQRPSGYEIPFGVSYGTPFSSAPYGTFIFVRADVAGKSGFGVATGLINFTDDARPLMGDPYSLNSQGNTANPNGIATFTLGVHQIGASYSGDSSFLPSDSQPVTFTITKAQTQTALLSNSATVAEKASVTLRATVSTTSNGNPPTGKIAFFAGSKLLAPPVPVTGSVDPSAGTAVGTAVLTTTRLPVGQDNVTAKYIGDENYVGSISAPVEITVTEQ